jgi:hypothetical protein
MKERIYAVYHGTEARLVRSSSRAQAMHHAAHTTFNVRVADQNDLVTLLGKGVQIESVKGGDQLELTNE